MEKQTISETEEVQCEQEDVWDESVTVEIGKASERAGPKTW
jgi:hypothetical protein